MKIILDGKGKPRAEPTPDDEWCILVFETGPEKDRITIVGPYDTMTRPEADREEWLRQGKKCVLARMMPPDEFELAMESQDDVHFGFAANVSEGAKQRPKRGPRSWIRRIPGR